MALWPEGTPDDDKPIWDTYHGFCVCLDAPGVCLHEDPPKSMNPNWKNDPKHRYLVCAKHHDLLTRHEMSRSVLEMAAWQARQYWSGRDVWNGKKKLTNGNGEVANGERRD